MKEFLSACKRWTEAHPSAPLTLIRVYVGLGLLIKGIYFLSHREVLDAMVQSAALPSLPIPAATIVIWGHLIGGALMAVGLFTRLAALVQIPIFYGAIAYVYTGHMNSFEAREGFEFAGLMFFLCGLLMAFGAGPWSLDYRLVGYRMRKTWVDMHPDVFLDLVRMFLGVALFMKGVFFMMHRDYLLAVIDRAGTWSIFPITLAHYVIPAHLVGGILLALGVLTRAGALAQIPIMLMAVFYVYLPKMMAIEGREKFEFSALVLMLVCVVVAFGCGRWGLEHHLGPAEDRKLQTKPAS